MEAWGRSVRAEMKRSVRLLSQDNQDKFKWLNCPHLNFESAKSQDLDSVIDGIPDKQLDINIHRVNYALAKRMPEKEES
jgi:hypothetical protein